ncbi:MAG: ABC transporter permease [Acetobacteraceae bacterium]
MGYKRQNRHAGAGGGAANASPAAPAGSGLWVTVRRGLSADWTDFWSNWTVVIALIVLCLVFGFATKQFFAASNLENVLTESAVLMIMAAGQSFVILTAGIDLSQAAVLTLCAVIMGEAVSGGLGIGIACLLALAGGLVAGALNGLVITKVRINDFIVTLGALGVASGIALVLTSGTPTQITSAGLLHLATGKVGPFGYPFLIAAAIVIVGQLVLVGTAFGTHVLATGGNREAARALGVHVGRMRIAVYAISGILIGLAAVLYTARIGAAEPAPNTTLLLDAIAATVLGGVSLFGGRGTILAPALGAILLTALQNGLTLMAVSQFYEPLVVGLVVVLAASLMRYQRS